MANEEVVDVKGVVTGKAKKETKKGNEYFEYQIETEGRSFTWRWFIKEGDENAISSAESVKVGSTVEGLGTISEGEWEGKTVHYRNIKELHPVGTVSAQKCVKPSDYGEAARFRTACFLTAKDIVLKELDRVKDAPFDMNEACNRIITTAKFLHMKALEAKLPEW